MSFERFRFVTFEGPEGAGKTTQAKRLCKRLEETGFQVLLTREPGGTALGRAIRELVLSDSGLDITPRAETLLYCAARAQLVERALLPALADGKVVVLDRYADSTLAYQGYGRGLDIQGVREVLEFATSGLRPGLSLLLDLPVETGLNRKRAQRTSGTAEEWNRFESEDLAFHERIRQAYLDLARAEPIRWRVVDASSRLEEVADEVWRYYQEVCDELVVLNHDRFSGYLSGTEQSPLGTGYFSGE
jgi:dTMP kinase